MDGHPFSSILFAAHQLGARTLLGAPGIATRSKKLLGTKGIATRSNFQNRGQLRSLFASLPVALLLARVAVRRHGRRGTVLGAMGVEAQNACRAFASGALCPSHDPLGRVRLRSRCWKRAIYMTHSYHKLL